MRSAELKRVALSSGEAVYREAGEGFPVVVVPGLGLTSRFYENSYHTFARAGLRLMFGDVLGCKGRGWRFAGHFTFAGA